MSSFNRKKILDRKKEEKFDKGKKKISIQQTGRNTSGKQNL